MERSKLIQLVVLGALAAALAGALGAFVFIKSGIYNVAASKPHTKFTFYVTNETMIHSVRSHAKGIVAPRSAGAAQVVRGFCVYETHCVACHGAAAVARERWAGGMEPQPPYLLEASRRWKPRELFWIVRNGVKMTGMPSWRDALSDVQIWDVVAFLEATGQMPPQTYVQWRSQGRCGPINPGAGP